MVWSCSFLGLTVILVIGQNCSWVNLLLSNSTGLFSILTLSLVFSMDLFENYIGILSLFVEVLIIIVGLNVSLAKSTLEECVPVLDSINIVAVRSFDLSSKVKLNHNI